MKPLASVSRKLSDMTVPYWRNAYMSYRIKIIKYPASANIMSG